MSDSFDKIREMYIPIPTRFGTIFAYDTYPNTGYIVSGDYEIDSIPTNKPPLVYKFIPFHIRMYTDTNESGVYIFEELDFVYPCIKSLSNTNSFSEDELKTIYHGLVEDFNSWVIDNPDIIKKYAINARQSVIEEQHGKIEYHQKGIKDAKIKIHDIQKDINKNFS